MPGIPRTKRCQRCKKRRTKCDERWPTCTACKLAGVACSGPPTAMKFVHNGRHEPTPIEEPQPQSQEIPQGTWPPLVHSISRNESNGTSYGLMRLAPPRPAPTTVADRVSASWVAQFNTDPVRDILKTVGYSPLLPRRVAESPALRDVLALFSSTWSHFRRGKTVDGLVDVKAYAKAIRSLRRAIEHSTEFAACETLAATVLLERFEVLFDSERSYHRCIHGRSVYSILARKGPPDLSNNLHVCLALESQTVVQNHCLVTGDENFYNNTQWQRFLDQALSADFMTYEQRSAYKMERLLHHWPRLCANLDELRRTPESDVHAKGKELHESLMISITALQSIGEEVTAKLRELGRITTVDSDEWMTHQQYEFSAVAAPRCFLGFHGFSILLNRMLHETERILGRVDPSIDIAYRASTRHIWRCYPFFRRLGRLAEVLFCSSLILTYEAADNAEKAMLLDCFREQDKFRMRLPTEDKPLESYILHTARIMTGRTYLPSHSCLRNAPLRHLPSDEAMALCEQNSLL